MRWWKRSIVHSLVIELIHGDCWYAWVSQTKYRLLHVVLRYNKRTSQRLQHRFTDDICQFTKFSLRFNCRHFPGQYQNVSTLDFINWIYFILLTATQISCNKKRKNTINQHNHKLPSAWALWRWSLAMVRLPQRVFLANHLASNDNLTRTTKDRTHSNEN